MARASGGQEKSVLFPINAAHTTVTTAAALTVNEDIVTTDVQKDGVAYDLIKFDSETVGFIQDHASAATSSTSSGESVTTEKGTVANAGSASSSTADQYIDVIYGGTQVDPVSAETVQIVTVVLGTVSGDSLAFKQEFQKWLHLPFKIDGVEAKADITLPDAIFDTTTLIDATALTPDLVFPKGFKKYVYFLKAHA